ncbi:MAG TPA: anti-sigma factor [Burkholderiaceae bacterium]|nr:anti-sigma factor [Burkholderiaceae bacterium]
MSHDDELPALIRRHATRHAAPDSLRAGIAARVALEEARRASATAAESEPAPRRWVALRWRAATLGFALGMLCMALLWPLAQRLSLQPSLESELVASHVRALQAGPITEVASSDRHTVKPWFQGRLDFAPPVVDLAGAGFPLLGARVEHVRGETVAALVYGHNRHLIDVFVWPVSGQQAPLRTTHRGFNVVHWSDGAMQYWAVGDLDRQEIEAFAQRWLEQAHGP